MSSVTNPAFKGALDWAVEPVVTLSRLLWRRWGETGERPSVGWFSNESDLADHLLKESGRGARQEACEAVARAWFSASVVSIQESLTFAQLSADLLPRIPPQDVAYFARRCIRRRHGLQPRADVAHDLHQAAQDIAALQSRYHDDAVPYSEFLDSVGRSGPAATETDVPLGTISRGFAEFWVVTDLIAPASGRQVMLRREAGDPERLAGYLFGVPTTIPGFDSLFGGGGLMFTDTCPGETSLPPESPAMGGRVVLTRGPFGSGKTLLSLRMAVEVARKGGVAWVMALEQTDEECLYALESVGISTRCDAFRVFQGLGESYVAFAQSSPARGALVLLRGCQTPEGNLEDFLGTVSERLHWMEHYPLRLLIVDPINALAPPKSFTNRGLRGATRKMFEIAKLAGVNIWLTSERTLHPREDRFEENIADTVIHLDVERDGGQQIRYVEITKSRFQHECSGRHSFVIDSADGPHIYLSSSAFRSTLPPERGLALGEKTEFGVSGIDPLLGKDAVRPGDVIVLAGPGKAKTLLGVQFILAKLAEADYRCVIVSDYSQARLERYLKQQVESRSDIPNSALDRIERCRIQVGYTDPGEVLLNIEQRLRHCSSSRPCARALVTNLARWEEEMPLIRKDPGFAVALVALFRSYGIATICVCGDEIDRNKSLITDILSDQSDFLLHFYRKEMKGRSTTLISAVKSRLMQHRREMFELTVSDARLEVVPAPLFRTTAGGEIYPVKVRLFLKAETPNQKKYTERILNSLIATISPDVTVVPQEKSYDPAFMTMAQYSAVDELQILQLDEFQISRGTFATAPPYLTTFERAKGGDLLDNVYGGFADRVCCDSGKKFFAVPFYGNISFLAFQHDAYKRCGVRLPGGKLPGSWAELARLCDLWEGTRQARKNESLFFSCPVYEDSVETYNCLYFEILYSLVPDQFRKSSDLVELLSLPAAVEAASLFRRLCRRSHAFGYGSKTPDARRQPAVFWRHWYNTLNQELSDMEPSERAGVRVQPLFGNVTTAGEWYLAIPSHSACPEIGLHIIERLTTPDREMLRLRLGVGLPTRADFYEEGQSGGNDDDGVKVSPYFGFGRSELATLVRNAIRRSSFSLYQRCSRTFSSHLQWILEVPEPKPKRRHQDVAVYEELARTIKDLVAHLIVLRGKK